MRGITLTADPGSFAISGGAASLIHDRVLECVEGWFSVNPENLLIYSADFSQWSSFASPIVTTNTDLAPDGSLTADTIEDNGGLNEAKFRSTFSGVGHIDLTTGDGAYFSIYVKKDSTGRAVRWVQLQMQFEDGGTTEFNRWGIDTSNGQSIEKTKDSSSAVFSVDDAGDYWRVLIKAKPDDNANRQAEVWIYPAAGAGSSWTYNDATTGSAVFWGASLSRFNDATITTATKPAYIGTGASAVEAPRASLEHNRTLAAGQGVFSVNPHNELTAPQNFSDASWTKSGSPSITSDTAFNIFGEKVADDVTDSNSTGFSYISRETNFDDLVGVDEDKILTFSVYAKKDSIGRSTRFGILQIAFSGGTSENNIIAIE